MFLILSSLFSITLIQIVLNHNFFCVVFILASRICFASRFIGGSVRLVISKRLEVLSVCVYAFWFVMLDKFEEPIKFIIYVLLSAIMYLLMWYDDYMYLQVVEREEETDGNM